LDTSTVVLINASRQSFESQLEVNLILMFAVRVEDELVEELGNDLPLVFRGFLFT